MKDKIMKTCVLLTLAIAVVVYCVYINRSIKREEIPGFYYGNFSYGIKAERSAKSSFMLILETGGTYHYSYVHVNGNNVYCKGDWETYLDDRNTMRIVFTDISIVTGDNKIPQKHVEDTYLKRNFFGSVSIIVNYDEGMLLTKQTSH